MTRDDVVNRAAEESKDHRGHLRIWLSGGLLLLGVLALAAAVFIGRAQNDVLNDKVGALTGRADTAERAVSQLADQVRKLGGTPVVAPPAQGATGSTGAQGIPGRDGPQGVPGQSPACLATAAQCQGADGKPGADGPQGVPGATGPAGKDGAQGADGKPGADGAPGKDGPPGVSVTHQYFDRDADGQCHTYTDFSDGRTRVDEGPAGDAACPAPSTPPPTQTTPAILPPGVTKRRRD